MNIKKIILKNTTAILNALTMSFIVEIAWNFIASDIKLPCICYWDALAFVLLIDAIRHSIFYYKED